MYMECSSKESRNVQDVFDLAVNTAIAVEDRGREDAGKTGGGRGGNKVKKRTCKIL